MLCAQPLWTLTVLELNRAHIYTHTTACRVVSAAEQYNHWFRIAVVGSVRLFRLQHRIDEPEVREQDGVASGAGRGREGQAAA
jgi:hypothetical protein